MASRLVVRAALLSAVALGAFGCVNPRSGDSADTGELPDAEAGGPADDATGAADTMRGDAIPGDAIPSDTSMGDTGPAGSDDAQDAPADVPVSPVEAGDPAPDAPRATSDADAAPGAVNGTACASGSSCASGYCADGVCCEAACAGQCEACAEPGQAGKCVAALGAPRAARPACAGQGTVCGASCNGINRAGCTYPAAEKECAAASCQAGVAYARALCDGKGACSAQTTVQCGAAGCAGSICAGGCSPQSPCPADQHCSGGRCFPRQAAGIACTAAEACQSGKCVDGVCCATACEGSCEACTSAKTGATDGTCAPIPAGTNPDGECANEGASSCGHDGTCDGARACRRYPTGTPCAAAGCSAGAFTPARTCNGAGTCTAATPINCGSFACFSGGCRTSCTVDGDCASPNTCQGGSCGSKKAQGASCGAASECASNSCVDGVCCDTGCPGVCNACRQAKTGQPDGKCAPVSLGTDPDQECPDDGASSCDRDGTCNGAGACRNYAPGTPCGATACNGSQLVTGGTCDGSGTCGSGSMTECSPYACTTSGCKASCTGAAPGQHPDCATGFGCEDGGTMCKPLNGIWEYRGIIGGGEIQRPAGPDPSGPCVVGSSWFFKTNNTPMGIECQVVRHPALDGSCVNTPGTVAYTMNEVTTIRDCATSVTHSPSAYRYQPNRNFSSWCLPSGSTTAACGAFPHRTGCDNGGILGRVFRCHLP